MYCTLVRGVAGEERRRGHMEGFLLPTLVPEADRYINKA